MGVSARRGSWSSSQTPSHASNMKAFILSLVVVAVTGDAKPWTVGQVAAGLPVLNAAAEGRLHNIGVITNAAQAGVTHVASAVPLSYHVPAAPVHNIYYVKREAEAEADPYTLAQVAAGQTAGGLITAIDYGHNTGLRPVVPASARVKAVSAVSAVPAVYSHIPYIGGAVPHVYYGKREAEPEPYTVNQVAAGQTAGGVITSVGGVPVVPHHAPVSVPHSYTVPHTPLEYNLPTNAAYPAYGKREADPEPYTLAQVAAGQTAGGVITSVGGVSVVPHRAPVSVYTVPHTPLVYNHPVYYSNFLG